MDESTDLKCNFKVKDGQEYCIVGHGKATLIRNELFRKGIGDRHNDRFLG